MTAAADILHHLQACDAGFSPPLSTRVDLAAYAAKLATHALCFAHWEGDLLGLVAVYANQPPRAFVTNVSVLPSHQGQGIARALMTQALDHLRGAGFTEVALEVAENALPARRLYTRLGFRPSGALMILNLGQDAAHIGDAGL